MPLLRSNGLELLGRREGLVKESASAAAASLKNNRGSAAASTAGSGEGIDGTSARYAIMMQTGDKEISLAPLGSWLTFRPLKIDKRAFTSHAGGSGAGATGDSSSSSSSSSSLAAKSSKAKSAVPLSSTSVKRSSLLEKLKQEREERAKSDPAFLKESSDTKKKSKGKGRGGGGAKKGCVF